MKKITPRNLCEISNLNNNDYIIAKNFIENYKDYIGYIEYKEKRYLYNLNRFFDIYIYRFITYLNLCKIDTCIYKENKLKDICIKKSFSDIYFYHFMTSEEKYKILNKFRKKANREAEIKAKRKAKAGAKAKREAEAKDKREAKREAKRKAKKKSKDEAKKKENDERIRLIHEKERIAIEERKRLDKMRLDQERILSNQYIARIVREKIEKIEKESRGYYRSEPTEMKGDIGSFDNSMSKASDYLMKVDIQPDIIIPSETIMKPIMKDNNADSSKIHHSENTYDKLLNHNQRKKIIEFMDNVHKHYAKNKKDIKIVFGNKKGENNQVAFCSLLGNYDGEIYDNIVRYNKSEDVKIVLRRTSCVDGCINFHCDNGSKHTVQITLNCDTEYKGGRIVFYTKNGFSIHKRPAGFLTSHDWNILHGVTKIHSGVRYSLFVVDKTNELGREGVYYMDVSDINTFETKYL